MTMYQAEKQIAIEAVTQAAHLCRSVQEALVSVDTLSKSDRSPVTVADFGSQALVCRRLQQHFPDDPIVAEEDASQLRQSTHKRYLEQVTQFVQQTIPAVTPQQVCKWVDAGNGQVSNRYWTLDPIDGTKGFLRREQYAVALALIEHGRVKVAALACPMLPARDDTPNPVPGTLFVAVHGNAAEMAPLDSSQFEAISVAGSGSNLRFVESVEPAHSNLPLQASIAEEIGITQPPLQMDSQAKYGVVARGDAALYLRLPALASYIEKIWDHAAGSLIVEEAGGRVTDMYGRPLDFGQDHKLRRNQGVIVSRGDPLHTQILTTISKI